jgi:hypothetical protein
MPILEARIETERASRYLGQFCKHAAAMGGGGHSSRMHLHGMMASREVQVAAEWSDVEGTVTFTPWGRCTLAADAHTLTLRIQAADEDGLRQIQDVVARDFERFSRRDPLTLTWHQPEHSDEEPGTGEAKPPRRRGDLAVLGLAVAVVVIILLHLGLAGTIAANAPWTGMATNIVLALVALKIALIALARFRIRRRKAALEQPTNGDS